MTRREKQDSASTELKKEFALCKCSGKRSWEIRCVRSPLEAACEGQYLQWKSVNVAELPLNTHSSCYPATDLTLWRIESTVSL